MGNRPYSTEAGWGRLGTGKRRCYNGFNMARPLSLPRTIPRLQLWVWARRSAPAFALPLILAAALALRLYGIDWDQGNLFHADERDLLMRVDRLALPPASDLGVLLNAEESPWNPGWFNYGSLPLYALKGVDLAAAAFTNLDIFQLRYPGRAISALADTLTVLVAYGLALRLGRGRAAGASGAGKARGAGRIDRRAALLAAAFLAVAVLHIQLSHFFAPDTLMTLFVLLSLYGAVRAAQGGRLGWSVLAGAGLGLALGTKFSAAPLLLPLGLAHALPAWRAWREGRDDWWRAPATGLVLAAAVGAVVLFLVQPYGFLDWDGYWRDLGAQGEMVRREVDYPFTRQYADTLPYLYQVRQLAVFGLGLPLGLVAWGGLLFALARWLRLRDPALLVLLAWAVPFLAVTGAFPVKFTRYLLPVTPLLVIFGAQMLVSAVDWARGRGERLALLVKGAAALALVLTALYALAFTGIYSQDHTAVRASAWVQEHVPAGSTVLKEHWDDGLPAMWAYTVEELPLYDPDGPNKTALLTERLARADFLTMYSSRLYGSIPRLEERYPETRRYYELLFQERLGYRLVHTEAAYPSLGGVVLANDTFSRAGLAKPEAVERKQRGLLTLDLGYADDSLVVFDHPMPLVFKNEERLSAEELGLRLRDRESAAPGFDPLLAPADEWAAQQRGGTWREIAPADGLGARLPVLVWLAAVYAATVVVLPGTLTLFGFLPDRGYLLAKPLGLLMLAYVPWLLASLKWLPFSRGSVALGLAVLAVVSLAVAARDRGELWAFVRQRWRLLAVGEAVFLLAFFAFVLVRMANPDLWHAWTGGEKPFDFAYLNAVVRSTYMPPYDPWFAGGAINYYYFGHFMVAALIRLTGVPSEVAYNLAVPLFFALTAACAFCLGYNLTEGARRVFRRRGDGGGPAWGPWAAAVGAVLFVAVLGNLDGGIQVLQGAWEKAVNGGELPAFDYWRSSRMMPPDPPGFEITEFPFFTFLFADLHAHLMALPVGLLALGLALNAAMASTGGAAWGRRAAGAAALGLVVGALWAINAWDFPTYFLVALAALAGGEWLAARRWSWRLLGRVSGLAGVLAAAAVLPWLPYHLRLEGALTGLSPSPAQTPLASYVMIHGLFLFLVMSLAVFELRLWGREAMRRGAAWLRGEARRPLRWGLALAGVAAATLVGALVWAGFPTVGLLLALLTPLLLLLWLALATGGAGQPDAPATPIPAFVLLLAAVTLALGAAVDLVVVGRDIERLNTVFKLYMHGWVFLALAGAYALWHVGLMRGAAGRRGLGRLLWTASLAVLVLGASVYPVLGTRERVGQRFQPLPATLDGTAFMAGARYSDGLGEVELEQDARAIRWLRETVEGSPVVLEAVTPEYSWGARVSTYTGLPTVLGWRWHEAYRKCGLGDCEAVDARVADVALLYSTTDTGEASRLLARYGVRYVYVGQTEQHFYPAEGLAKFGGMAESGALRTVYEEDGVVIYRVEAG